MSILNPVFDLINNLTWGWALVPFLVIFGLFFTGASGFIQFRFFKRMFNVLTGDDETNDPTKISAREALFVSVGGRVGGGNIAGVAVAITAGGPGAVFWMWMIALVGMCTSLVEATLAQLYKETTPEGDYRGGPARVIVHGLGENYRWLAVVYAVCLIASFSIGFNAFQGNTVAGAALDSLSIPRFATGAVLAVVTGFIIYGGIHRIAKAAERLATAQEQGLDTVDALAKGVAKQQEKLAELEKTLTELKSSAAPSTPSAPAKPQPTAEDLERKIRAQKDRIAKAQERLTAAQEQELDTVDALAKGVAKQQEKLAGLEQTLAELNTSAPAETTGENN